VEELVGMYPETSQRSTERIEVIKEAVKDVAVKEILEDQPQAEDVEDDGIEEEEIVIIKVIEVMDRS
jgi:hypothetical protein